MRGRGEEGTVLGVRDSRVWPVISGLFRESISLCPDDEELPLQDLNVSVSLKESHLTPVHLQSPIVHGPSLLPSLGIPSFPLRSYPLSSLCKVYKIVIELVQTSVSSLKSNPILPPSSPRKPFEIPVFESFNEERHVWVPGVDYSSSPQSWQVTTTKDQPDPKDFPVKTPQ